jgi:hypothetical protein
VNVVFLDNDREDDQKLRRLGEEVGSWEGNGERLRIRARQGASSSTALICELCPAAQTHEIVYERALIARCQSLRGQRHSSGPLEWRPVVLAGGAFGPVRSHVAQAEWSAKRRDAALRHL